MNKDLRNDENALLDQEEKDSRVYYISSVGRFGYLINLLLGLTFSWGIFVPFWPMAHHYSFGAKLFLFFLGVGSWYLMIYSGAQLFRKSPRFVLDDNGFAYNGLIVHKYIFWSDVESLKISGLAGGGGFVFLSVRLKSASLWSRNIKFDVSGMSPKYEKLYNKMISCLLDARKLNE